MLNAAINSRKQQTDKEARKLDTLQKEMAKVSHKFGFDWLIGQN